MVTKYQQMEDVNEWGKKKEEVTFLEKLEIGGRQFYNIFQCVFIVVWSNQVQPWR